MPYAMVHSTHIKATHQAIQFDTNSMISNAIAIIFSFEILLLDLIIIIIIG